MAASAISVALAAPCTSAQIYHAEGVNQRITAVRSDSYLSNTGGQNPKKSFVLTSFVATKKKPTHRNSAVKSNMKQAPVEDAPGKGVQNGKKKARKEAEKAALAAHEPSSKEVKKGKKGEEKMETAAEVTLQETDEEEAAEEDILGEGESTKKTKLKAKKDKKKLKGNTLSFSKYHGLGNDFLLVDNLDSSEPRISPEQAIKICDRNFGVGGDGVIFALPGTGGADFTMRIFNSDGSEPEMCGNGIRCMARFVAELEEAEVPTSYTVQTLAGIMVLNLRGDGQVAVDMGPPTLAAADVPTTLLPTNAEGAVVGAALEVDGKTWKVTCVSMGNPHCVTFANDAEANLSVEDLDLARIGPMFENNAVFPARINTEFVEVLSPTELKMRVWERGAGATLACGTGACALVVAAVLEGRAERKCVVHLPGGPLEIEWREADGHVYMTGPAELVFKGKAVL